MLFKTTGNPDKAGKVTPGQGNQPGNQNTPEFNKLVKSFHFANGYIESDPEKSDVLRVYYDEQGKRKLPVDVDVGMLKAKSPKLAGLVLAYLASRIMLAMATENKDDKIARMHDFMACYRKVRMLLEQKEADKQEADNVWKIFKRSGAQQGAKVDAAKVNAAKAGQQGANVNEAKAAQQGANVNAAKDAQQGANVNAAKDAQQGAKVNTANAAQQSANVNAANAAQQGANVSSANVAAQQGAKVNMAEVSSANAAAQQGANVNAAGVNAAKAAAQQEPQPKGR